MTANIPQDRPALTGGAFRVVPGAPGGLRITLGQRSGAGRKPVNQDAMGAAQPEVREVALKGIALAVADGISSSAVSQIAAQAAVLSFLSDYYCTSDAWTVKTAASRVIRATNSWLHAETLRSQQGRDMDRGYVCTFTALVLKARQVHIFHIGDSRAWRLSGETLEPLTTDHRVVLSSVESYLGRALGMAPEVEIDYRAVDLRAGDVFVLTTDGIHEHVAPREMARLIRSAADPEAAADAIATLAHDNGSPDNLTLLIVRIDGLPDLDATGFLEGTEMLPPPPLPNVPSAFDGYRLLRQIHANSRSHIFLALDPETGDPVALKLPSIDLRDDPAYLRRFMMEEWIARRLTSPHVLKAAPARPRRFLYTVTEYVEGQTLRQWMHDNPRPDLETVRDLVEQIAKGLRAFHRKEMLHQDLRPENILIDRNGTVKILDFGSTRVAGVSEASPALDSDDILGTLQYTAPEYFLGAPGTQASDRFSLGVIAYEMLTGRLPYGAGVSRARTAKAQSRLRYQPATTPSDRIPDWVDDALRRAVHPDPHRRTPALSEFTADLRRPPAAFAPRAFVPLAVRNPVRFWQGISCLLGLAVLVLLAWR